VLSDRDAASRRPGHVYLVSEALTGTMNSKMLLLARKLADLLEIKQRDPLFSNEFRDLEDHCIRKSDCYSTDHHARCRSPKNHLGYGKLQKMIEHAIGEAWLTIMEGHPNSGYRSDLDSQSYKYGQRTYDCSFGHGHFHN